MFKVARLVGLVVVPEGGGLVDYRGAGGQNMRAALDRGVQRRGVDERLENGSRLAFGEHVIKLAYAVVTAARQCPDFAGVRIEGDERTLRFGNRLALESLLFPYLFV